MMFALATHDFSILYVAENNARETPIFYSIISLWAALEGSILLWTAILAGATAFIAFRGTQAIPRLATTALAVMFAMLTFFLLLITTPAADPFTRLAVAPDNGNGPNALLQNHPLMALHPPLLYLGYVLTSVPFAYAIASLILGEGGDRWLVATRRFALVSWALLGVGIVAGSWWSYAVLGWGGYWAWDPVENAAIMPWLVATAYLHSVMVEEKRRLLRSWNLSLVIATFALTILGTFLTRSGVVNSVHAFIQSAIGPLLLCYLVAIVVLRVGLPRWRLPALRVTGAVGAPRPRRSWPRPSCRGSRAGSALDVRCTARAPAPRSRICSGAAAAATADTWCTSASCSLPSRWRRASRRRSRSSARSAPAISSTQRGTRSPSAVCAA